MFRLHTQRLVYLTLLLVHQVLGGQYRFYIKEIDVVTSLVALEDDLHAVIAADNGVAKSQNNWTVGSYYGGQSVQGDALDQLSLDVDSSDSAANLSVAFGLLNVQDADETRSIQLGTAFAEGIVNLTGTILSPLVSPYTAALDWVINAVGDLFDCSGPVAVDMITCEASALDSLEQNQELCNTTSYVNSKPHWFTCGAFFGNSNYTVTYCLERLDDPNAPSTADSAAASPRPNCPSWTFILFMLGFYIIL